MMLSCSTYMNNDDKYIPILLASVEDLNIA
jgi:hypothetical protein